MVQPRVDLPLDLRDQDVEIRISRDGKTLWVNTVDGCVLRVHNVGKLAIVDDRSVGRRSRQSYGGD